MGLVFSFSLLMCSFPAIAQEKIKVKEAVGEQVVEDNITPAEAVEIAFREAKKEAMRKAGIPEKVWSVLGQITDSKNSELIEAYSEMSSITLNGLVTVSEKTVQNIWDPSSEKLSKRVIISAQVLKEAEPDAEFAIEPKGFKAIYKEGEELVFDVKIYNRDAYLKVFWFDSKEGAVVFPLQSDVNEYFVANAMPHFPQGNMKYTLMKTDKNALQEEVNIMIVATKDNIPFIGKVSFESVIKWIYSIPANKRVSCCSRFVIM